MSFATAGLAIWAAIFVIPLLLLLYFLKLKRIEREISTTLLWKKAIQDFQANAPFQRLRKNILLFLQLLAIAAILLALAQPEIDAPQGTSNRYVIMIDRSASMNARDGSGPNTRLEQAKREAVRFIDGLRESSSGLGSIFENTIGQLTGSGKADEVMVITFDVNAQVRQSFTTEKSLLRSAIQDIVPTDAPSSLDEALRLAGAYTTPELIEDRGLVLSSSADLHLWSDGKLPDIEDVALPPQTTFVYHALGAVNSGNLSITAASVRRSYDQPDLLHIFISVQSTGQAPREVDVELALDASVVGIRRVILSRPVDALPDDPWRGGVAFTLRYPSEGDAVIRLLSDDVLAQDNTARLHIDSAQRLRVGVVTTGNLFLQTALEGMNLERLVAITPAELDKLVDSHQLDRFDVLLLDGVSPPVRNDRIVAGRYLVFNAVPKLPGITQHESVDAPTVVLEWDRDHAALPLANLDQLVIGKHLGISVAQPSVVLARSEHGPIIAEGYQGAAHVLAVAFDPTATNWPFDPGFVLFMTSAIEYLGERPGSADAEQLSPGQTLTYRTQGSPSRVTLKTPDARTIELIPDEGGEVSFGPLRHAGLYSLSWRADGDTQRRKIPVNMLNAAESDLGTRSTLAMASRVVESQLEGSSSQRRELWPWLILFAIGIILFEWYIYNRKVMI
jgi:aerotolerance regulator-like protein/VWA domain-containing protein